MRLSPLLFPAKLKARLRPEVASGLVLYQPPYKRSRISLVTDMDAGVLWAGNDLPWLRSVEVHSVNMSRDVGF